MVVTAALEKEFSNKDKLEKEFSNKDKLLLSCITYSDPQQRVIYSQHRSQLSWFNKFLLMKACQHTLTQYLAGSIKQVNLNDSGHN